MNVEPILKQILKDVCEELEGRIVYNVEIAGARLLTAFEVPSVDGCVDTYWVIELDANADGEIEPVIFIVGLQTEGRELYNCYATHYSIDVLHYGPLHLDQNVIDAVAEWLLRAAGVH